MVQSGTVSKVSATAPTASVASVLSLPSRLALPFSVVTSVFGVVSSALSIVQSRESVRRFVLHIIRLIKTLTHPLQKQEDPWNAISAGFLTGGSLAVRGGVKAARNSAIMCAIFLGVIEGVGIGFQRMMADNTKLDVCGALFHSSFHLIWPMGIWLTLINLASSSSPLRSEGSCLNSSLASFLRSIHTPARR